MIDPDTFDRICEQIADGRSLASILKDDGMPPGSRVYRALAEDKGMQERYARAREAQADKLFEEVLDLADERGEDVQRSRLMVDARKWMAGKLRPKVYGERVDHDVNGAVELTINVRRFGEGRDRPAE